MILYKSYLAAISGLIFYLTMDFIHGYLH